MLSVIKNIFSPSNPKQEEISRLLNQAKKNERVEIYEKLGLLYSEQNDTENAAKYLQKACEIYISQQRYKQLQVLYEKLTLLEPDTIDHRIALADINEINGDIYGAIENYKSALKLDPDNPDIYFKLANTYASLQEFDKAIYNYEKILNILPDSAGAHCALAIALKDINKINESIKLFECAIKLNDTQPESYHNLGLAYFEKGDFEKAIIYFEKASNISIGEAWNENIQNNLDQISKTNITIANSSPPIFKCKHDLEQFKHLIAQKKIPGSFSIVIDAYEKLINEIKNKHTQIEISDLITNTYNKPIYINRNKSKNSAVNPELDIDYISKKYFESEPNATYFDNFLTNETLNHLREFCLENSFWNIVKDGYLGATMPNGFFSETLLEIADQLRSNFPDIFKDHQLQTMWAFKYDSQLNGINLHADDAAINVNFWITDENANLDKNSGGLVFFDKTAPKEWGFNMYNMDVETIQEYLESVNSKSISIPYKENRAVLFDSDLFHRTDDFNFKDGYENRRINITMLFGLRNI